MRDIDRDNYRIVALDPRGGGRIRVQFIHGPWVEVDFAEAIAEGNMFANLADDAYLAQARIGDSGYWIEWPGGLDFGADQMWWWATPVEQPVAVAK